MNDKHDQQRSHEEFIRRRKTFRKLSYGLVVFLTSVGIVAWLANQTSVGIVAWLANWNNSPTANCTMPKVYPYPQRSTYWGVHANRENNNRIPCSGPASVTPSYLALKGKIIFQPITFSADGLKLYAPALDPTGCTINEVTLATGATRCLGNYNASVAFGSIEVDETGNLYFSVGDRETGGSEVYSLNANGGKRWTRPLTHSNAVGMHFTPRGDIAIVGMDGVVSVLSRDKGLIIAEFNIPSVLGLSLPTAVDTPFYSSNTISISRKNQLFAIMNADGGARLVALNIGSNRSLSLAWSAKLQGQTSGTTPSVTNDGRYIAVGDNEAGLYMIDVDSCNAYPSACAPAWRYQLSGSLGGNSAFDENNIIYSWNQGDQTNTLPDIFAIQSVTGADGKPTPKLVWGHVFSGKQTWTSAITVLNNYLLGTVSTKISQINGEPVYKHELIAIDKNNGNELWRSPADDDSDNSVALGPDGALYVPYIGVIDLKNPGSWSGGVRRYVPAT